MKNDAVAEFREVVSDTLNSLGWRRRTSNVYLNSEPYEAGATIGPQFQELRAAERCFVVFIDHCPGANFGHPCSYRLYSAATRRFMYEVRARFPPYVVRIPETYFPVFEPVQPAKLPSILPPRRLLKEAPSNNPIGERYAILFAGSGVRRAVNDLEYCFRLLTDRYQFNPNNVRVLYYNGAFELEEQNVPVSNWPNEGDAEPYTMTIHGAGTGDAFRDECTKLAAILQTGDRVFVHTNGHGDAIGGESFVYQCDGGRYLTTDFCAHLGCLPSHASLLVMMQQCYSAGFIAPLLAARQTNQIRAQRLAVACASAATSWQTADWMFNRFTKAWVAAQWGVDLLGIPVDSDIITQNGFVEADEAFGYAASVAQSEIPESDVDPPCGASIRLS
jgi:hypothetical protein